MDLLFNKYTLFVLETSLDKVFQQVLLENTFEKGRNIFETEKNNRKFQFIDFSINRLPRKNRHDRLWVVPLYFYYFSPAGRMRDSVSLSKK
jgi:hypothetical protein